MQHLDTDTRILLAREHVARLQGDYDSTPSSAARVASRLACSAIVVAIVAGLAVASAQARVVPSLRQTGEPTARVLVRMQASVPNPVGVRRAHFRMVRTAGACRKQPCKPAS